MTYQQAYPDHTSTLGWKLWWDASRWGYWVEPRDVVLVLDSLRMMEQIRHGLPGTGVVSEILDVLDHLTWLLA